MSRVLVAYASKHGATAEIAEAIADQLRQHGHAVDCVPADQTAELDSYDASVIGSAVYMKRWRPEARHLLKRHKRVLGERPFWVFSSGPFGEKPDPSWAEPPRIIGLAERLGARDHVVFGGRLPIEPGNSRECLVIGQGKPSPRAQPIGGAYRAIRLTARRARPQPAKLKRVRAVT